MFAIRLALAALFAPISLTVATSAVMAQSSVVIWPTDPKIVAGEQATALWLENRGTKTVTLQFRTFGWGQVAGEDSLQATNEIVSSPPLATVGPGERQLVRIIRRIPAAASERAFRLLIDELPTPHTAGADGVSARLSVQMRYSLPLFVYGSERAGLSPELTSRVVLDDGARWLEIRNSGNSHARLTDLRLKTQESEETLHAGLLGYVLPGSTMRWPLPPQLAPQAQMLVGINGADIALSTTSSI